MSAFLFLRTMSNEILSVLEYMEKEKGIGRSDMIDAISAAIADAAQKGIGAGREVRVEINPKTGSLKAWSILSVVDSISDSSSEIHIENSKGIMGMGKLALQKRCC